ncbi:MAG: hypothetical protein ACJ742_18975, partial [Actinomycetes bacterium]
RLGIEAVVDQLVDLGDRPGHYQPARKVLTSVHALVAGGDCMDDADVLCTESTAQVLGHRVMVPRTLATFLRSFNRPLTRYQPAPRWIQADIPQCMSEPLPASLRSVTESGQQKGAGR